MDLSENNLGENPENMRLLGEGFQYLSGLKTLSLKLNENILADNKNNLIHLTEALKSLN